MSSRAPERPLHHQYFMAAIATVVTVGAGWGVWLLFQIGVAGRFTGISLQDVNAHGQAQIDGWVGLFIMGFALQMFPPVWRARLAGRRWRLVPLAAMLAGVLLRSVAMSVPLGASGPPLALAGSALQLGATVLFAGMLVLTFRRSLERIQPWMGFVFLASAASSPRRCSTAGTPGERSWRQVARRCWRRSRPSRPRSGTSRSTDWRCA